MSAAQARDPHRFTIQQAVGFMRDFALPLALITIQDGGQLHPARDGFPYDWDRVDKFFEQAEREENDELLEGLRSQDLFVLGMFVMVNFQWRVYPNAYAERARKLWDKWAMWEMVDDYMERKGIDDMSEGMIEEADDGQVGDELDGAADDQEGDSLDADGDQIIEPSATAIKRTKTRSKFSAAPSRGTVTVREPPASEADYQRGGVMFGLTYNSHTGARTFHPRHLDQYTLCKVRGSNGLSPGAWFPNNYALRFNGAHGQLFQGICGDLKDGAYSITVGKDKKVVDPDNGDQLFYSGTEMDPLEKTVGPVSPGTQWLIRSCEKQTLVRVIRKCWDGDGQDCGYRYDGLYAVSRHKAMHGDQKYDRFELRRRNEDKLAKPWSELEKIPDLDQQKTYARVKEEINVNAWPAVSYPRPELKM